MKKILLILLCVVVMIPDVHAVLKEKDLENTLAILRTELTVYYRELALHNDRRQQMEERVGKQLREVMIQSNQNALMLYSQKQDYIFDLTYACHEATELYREFRAKQAPFKTFLSRTDVDVARYDSLIMSLNDIPVRLLNEKSKKDREACLILATSIRNTLKENNDQLNEFITYHDATERRLGELNDYAQKRYNDIQTSILRTAATRTSRR